MIGRFMPLLLSLLFFLMSSKKFAQPSEIKNSPQEYILQYKEIAINEMLTHGIPASITLAQGLLESGNGNSALSVYANNHFGIKCHKEWTGPSYVMDDDAENECFRKYERVADSYKDHSLFLKTRPRYYFLFELPTTDYRAWAKGLKLAGYATLPTYAEELIDLIERHRLYEYDKLQALTAKTIKPEQVKLKAEIKPVLKFNNIKFIIVKQGDTFYKLASENELEIKQLLRFNDMEETEKLTIGTKIYLEPKRKKAMESFHKVNKGETMKSIAQLHGIKLKCLYAKNNLIKGEEPETGQKLYLRDRNPEKIRTVNLFQLIADSE
jgi:LysM repeat protein